MAGRACAQGTKIWQRVGGVGGFDFDGSAAGWGAGSEKSIKGVVRFLELPKKFIRFPVTSNLRTYA
jgi:hypothetical protein